MEENQQNMQVKQPRPTAPYAVSSMVLGIASLVVSGLGITLVLGIIGLVLSNKGLAEMQENPGMYTGDGMLKAGKITSIIGIVLSSVALVTLILIIVGIVAVAAVGAGMDW